MTSDRIKILVVEDDNLLSMMAVDIVPDAGFEAVEARDADERSCISRAFPASLSCGRTSRCLAPWTGSSLLQPYGTAGPQSKF